MYWISTCLVYAFMACFKMFLLILHEKTKHFGISHECFSLCKVEISIKVIHFKIICDAF